MKKLIIMTIVMFAAGCIQKPPANNRPDAAVSGDWRFEKFHGHTWIVRETGYAESRNSFVIHDPNCECGWAVGPSKPAK